VARRETMRRLFARLVEFVFMVPLVSTHRLRLAVTIYYEALARFVPQSAEVDCATSFEGCKTN
jgi:hypothetical protein